MVKESITKSLALMEEQIVTAYMAKLRRRQQAMHSKLLIEVPETKAPSSFLQRELQEFNPSSKSNTLESNPLPQEKSFTPKIVITTPEFQVSNDQISDKIDEGEKAGIFTSLERFISRFLSK